MAKSKRPNTINIKLFNKGNVFDRWITEFQLIPEYCNDEALCIMFDYSDHICGINSRTVWTHTYNKGMIGQTKYKLNTLGEWKLFLNDLDALLTMIKIKHEDIA